MKRVEEAAGRGWREMAGVRCEELVVRMGEEDRGEGGSERAAVREEGGGAKGAERKEGEMEGFTDSCGGEGREKKQ